MLGYFLVPWIVLIIYNCLVILLYGFTLVVSFHICSAESISNVHVLTFLVDHVDVVPLRSQQHSLQTFRCCLQGLLANHLKWFMV